MNGSQPATDLTTVLARDHRVLDRLCTELELGQGSPENRKDLSDRMPQADQLWPGPGFVDRARNALRRAAGSPGEAPASG